MVITFIAASLGDGGAERVVSELASQMQRQGNAVSVITIGSASRSYQVAEGVQVIDCAQKYGIPGVGFARRVFAIASAVRQLKPDVCISFNTTVNIYAVLACGGLPCRLVLAERNDPRFYPTGKLQRLLRGLLYGRADRFVFQTEQARQWFPKKIRQRGTVIFNPINPELPEVCSEQRSKRVVTAVRLEPQKNLKMAIDAFAKLHEAHPDYVFEIYGKGSLRNVLAQQIATEQLQNCVILKGNSDTLYGDILDAEMFILSSDFEGMSNSMLEAMALGIPTVSTDYPSGGARAVIRDGINGLLIPVGDTDGLYRAMKRIAEDPELAKKLSENGALLRQQLSVERITQQWLDFIS